MKKLAQYNKLIFLWFSMILAYQTVFCQQKPYVQNIDQLESPMFANWITAPKINGNEYGVYYFRKTFEIQSVPQKFIVHVSADNRYRLYVNGEFINFGPAVGDMSSWYFDTYDIAPYLKAGKNCISAQVWNMGNQKGARQISNCTGFILQGGKGFELLVNTDGSWKVKQDFGYFPVAHSSEQVGGGFIAGATDSIDGTKCVWDWNTTGFSDATWNNAITIGKGNHSGLDTWVTTAWNLTERSIPTIPLIRQNINKMLVINGMEYKPDTYTGNWNLKIPPATKVEILLDNSQVTMGFPQLSISGGKHGSVKIQYQEKLFNVDGTTANRNVWQGKVMKGYYDVYVGDGGNNRLFQPLWIRTFRFVKLTIETKEDALIINDFYNLFAAYPFEKIGYFESENDTLQQICDVSWQTAKICALETYMDCPYYEQLQYIGDTRIQGLISLYMTGDARLMRNAIEQFAASRMPEGLTKSSYPSNGVQVIPPFSLIYIAMIHDYFMHTNDTALVKRLLPGIRFTLDWFTTRIDETGMLGALPYWNHVDGGVKEFLYGSPPGARTGHSANISLLLAYTISKSVEMFQYFHYDCEVAHYQPLAENLKKAVIKYCYDDQRKLIAETPDKKVFSQHTNAFAILCDAIPVKDQYQTAMLLLTDTSIAQATLYFKFYLFQALKKAGAGNKILSALGEWKKFIDYGFTTFPEHGIQSRSDCHAWSAHPLYDLLAFTCGIEPAAPCFKKVRIEPVLGNLQHVKGRVVCPSGNIDVEYSITDKKNLDVEIVLPVGLTGDFVWKNKMITLQSGKNVFSVK